MAPYFQFGVSDRKRESNQVDFRVASTTITASRVRGVVPVRALPPDNVDGNFGAVSRSGKLAHDFRVAEVGRWLHEKGGAFGLPGSRIEAEPGRWVEIR